jgi:hypothetical protein
MNAKLTAMHTRTIEKHPGFAVEIEVLKHQLDGRAPYVSNRVTSAPVFTTKFAADSAAVRAVMQFNSGGNLPNMCELF